LVERVERRPLERRRGVTRGHSYLRQSGRQAPGDAPSVVDPERFTRPILNPTPSRGGAGQGPAYSFGERVGVLFPTAAFQSALPPAVLLPESFRGGCSFGAALSRGLSCGRAISAASLASAEPKDQRVPGALTKVRNSGNPVLRRYVRRRLVSPTAIARKTPWRICRRADWMHPLGRIWIDDRRVR
jgi:hypothetical protein